MKRCLGANLLGAFSGLETFIRHPFPIIVRGITRALTPAPRRWPPGSEDEAASLLDSYLDRATGAITGAKSG